MDHPYSVEFQVDWKERKYITDALNELLGLVSGLATKTEVLSTGTSWTVPSGVSGVTAYIVGGGGGGGFGGGGGHAGGTGGSGCVYVSVP